MLAQRVFRMKLAVLIALLAPCIAPVRAEDQFSVVTSQTSDGFTTNVFNTPRLSSNEARGTQYWAETGTGFPVRIVLTDPENAGHAMSPDSQRFAMKLFGGELTASRLYATNYPDLNVRQFAYHSRALIDGEARTATIQITDDPGPLPALLVFGAAALICSANYLIELHIGRCASATLEVSVIPPSCKATCSTQ
ncbi:hypothetical protein [Thalassobaculum sp.]|uniref:hypothetical protein n=1 Tax=Thalassobaculum sp. TaxID=2022740 RepID=UPI0032ED984D